MKHWKYGSLAACVVLAIVGLGLVGCEDVHTSGQAITVTPSSQALGASSGETAVFTASAATNATLFLPLVWSVSNPSLGSISGRGGLSAVYTSTGRTGGNTITVRDQGEAEGVASVTQQAAATP